MNVRIKLMRNTSRMPEFKTPGAAGMDLYADILKMEDGYGNLIAGNGELIVMPGAIIKVPVGVGFELNPGVLAYIVGRSGNELAGIEVKLGTIDEDYRGEIHVIIKNSNKSAFIINQGDRIAQATIHEVQNLSRGVAFELADELSETKRGDGGFGHTGN